MRIPLFKICWEEEDVEAVAKVIRTGAYWCTGAEIEDFEEAIADYIGVKHCVVFNSGGAALYGLMNAYGFGRGDEVIVPSFTFIATAYAPVYVGAKPIFADIEDMVLGLDPEDVRMRIGPKTKAIMPIHYGGMPCRIDELKELADDKNLTLIEDVAESFGAKFRGKLLGTYGDSSMFSFCHNKIFTTSEGGCVVTDRNDIQEKLRLIRSYGRVVAGNYFAEVDHLDYVQVGYNLRLSTLLAALGISQLKRVDDMIDKRRRKAMYLNKHLGVIDRIAVPKEPDNDYYAVYQMYTIRVKEGSKRREELIEFLKEKGIASKVYFVPVHEYSVFEKMGYTNLSLSTTNRLASQVLTLPFYPHMTEEEMNYVIDSISTFFG